MQNTEPLPPVYTADLFPALNARLIALLRGLDADDWRRPTLAGSWQVRDVVGHLLDVDLRKLSGGRDRQAAAARPVSSFAAIVDLINELNAGGVGYARRLSTRLMTDLLEITGEWVAAYVASLPPHGEAALAVAWAGEERSENWMDIGREYTERWHHQMQVREAVGAPALLERRAFLPVLELSVRAFRRAYRDVTARAGTAVVFSVEAGGSARPSESAAVGSREMAWSATWSIVREDSGWRVVRGQAADAVATVSTDAESAWKLFYNALPSETARARLAVAGDQSLAEPILGARAVMV